MRYIFYGIYMHFVINRLEPLTIEEAIALYEQLPEKSMEFEEAFPGVEVEEG